jgi:lipopolysaccharide heptosyltransferase II
MTRSPITDPQLIREALEAGQIRRVLAVRASRLGDLLMATPGLHAFHERYPEAEITFLTNEYSRAFLENDPDIHELMTFKGRERDLLTSKAAPIRKEIQDKGIDLLLALRPRKEVSALAEKLQIPYLFPLGQRGTDSDEIHVVQQTFDRIAPIGLTGDPGPMRLFLAEEDLEAARARIPAGDGPVILLHPGGDDTKRLWLWRGVRKRIWPKSHWAELIQRLESGLGARVLVSSGNAIEARWVEDILGRFDNQATHLSRLPLRQFCALFELSDLVITGDTGPLHIAAALRRPQLCLFGPTAVTYTGPWNDKARVLRKEIPCSPCQGKKTRCLQNVCMEELLPSQVHGEARRYLEELAPPAAIPSAQ